MTRAVRPRSPTRTRAAAKSLRKRMTPAEARLWVQLREVNAKGARFRRQCPIGPFVVDFACPQHRVVVEVDGGGHDRHHVGRRDAERDRVLALHGFEVARFTNEDVMRALGGVVAAIHASVGLPAISTGAH